MLREALDFPTSGDHGSRALLVGSFLVGLTAAAGVGVGRAVQTGQLSLATGAVAVGLPALLAVRGYYYRTVAAAATTADPVAPSFAGVGRLLREGTLTTAVAVAYALPAALLFALAAGASVAAEGAQTGVELLAQSLGAAASLFAIVALCAGLYLTPAAMAALARGDGLRAAFQLRAVLDGAATEDYVVGWVLATALQWTFGVVGVAFATLLIGVVLYFLTAVAARYLWGSSFGAAVGIDGGVPKEGITPPNRDPDEADLQALLFETTVDEDSATDERKAQ